MARADAPDRARVDGLGEIALFLERRWRLPGSVSKVAVWRACRRRHDPLPTLKPLGRLFAFQDELAEWADRQRRRKRGRAKPPKPPKRARKARS